MRRLADGVMSTLVRILVHVFFRRVEVGNGQSILPGVPAVLVANKNAEAFAVCRRLLARGGLVALFPEGISHDEPPCRP